MRVALDARTLSQPKTGDRTVTLGFARGLIGLAEREDLELVLVSQEPIPEGLLPVSPRLSRHVVERPGGYLWMLRAFPRALRDLRAEVALIQYMGPFHAPCPVVTTIHDTVWRTMPKTFPWRDRLILNAFIGGTIRRAAAVTTGSEFSRTEILRYYPQAAPKLHVVPYAVDEAFRRVTDPAALQAVRRRYDLPRRFILSLGVLQPRKNVAGLLEAYGRLPAELREQVTLVIAGKRGWLVGETLALAERLAPQVRLIGYVADEDLPPLYSLAELFVYPSLYEGFGLPPLEAMACGTPTVTSKVASLPEVVGEAAILVNPTDPQALATALQTGLTDEALRGRLQVEGPAQAGRFTWERSAKALLAVLRSVTPD